MVLQVFWNASLQKLQCEEGQRYHGQLDLPHVQRIAASGGTMNNSEILELLNDLLEVIRQDARSPEARLVEIKNRIYQQQFTLERNRRMFAEKSVNREANGDVLFA